MADSDKVVLNQLASDHALWYRQFIRTHLRVPKAVSGVATNGGRFLFILDALDSLKIDHMQRHKFVKVLLEQERAASYAYGTLVMTYPEGAPPQERLDI